MEITIDTLISFAGLFIGGGGGAFFTWRWMRRKAKAEAQTEEVNMAKEVQDTYQQMLKDKDVEVQDKNRIIKELREDRDHYRQMVSEMVKRQDKTDETVRDLQMQVARNGRMVEMMRPFQCYDLKCKKRIRVPTSECEAVELPTTKDIEPYNDSSNA